MKNIFTIFTIFCSLSLAAQTDNEWLGGNGGWLNTAKCSLGVVPNNSHKVIIDVPGSTVTLGTAVTASICCMEVGAGSSIDINGSLSVSNTEWDGLDNLGTITVNGSIDVKSTNGSGNEGQGVKNAGTFTNDGSIVLGSAGVVKNGILNTSTGTFTNNGTISLENIDANGIRINGGTFDNYGEILTPGPVEGSFLITFGGNSTNRPCAIMDAGNQAFNASDFDNMGAVYELSTGNSSIDSNSGVVFNGNGGIFTISGNNTGLNTTETDLIYWTGCESNDWKDLDNWISPVPNFALASSHQYIPANVIGANGYPVASTKVNIDN